MTRKNFMSIPCLFSEVIKHFFRDLKKEKEKPNNKNHRINRDVPEYFEHYLQGWD